MRTHNTHTYVEAIIYVATYIHGLLFDVLIQPLWNDSGPAQPSSSSAASRTCRAASLEVCL